MTTISSNAWSPATDISGMSLSAGVMALMVQGRAAQGESARNDVSLNSERLERLRAEVQKAIEEAREAQDDAGFWGSIADFFGGDVAKVAGALAAVAATAASGGTALPFIAAGLACTAAAEIGAAAGLDPKVCLCLSVASAAFGLAAGDVGSGTFAKLSAGLTVVAGAAQATGGAASIVSGEYAADVLRAQAREGRAGAAQQQVQVALEQLLERLRTLQQDATRAIETHASTAETSRSGAKAVLENFTNR
jgi:hypothetical protein